MACVIAFQKPTAPCFDHGNCLSVHHLPSLPSRLGEKLPKGLSQKSTYRLKVHYDVNIFHALAKAADKAKVWLKAIGG